jgi:hypothetical protein
MDKIYSRKRLIIPKLRKKAGFRTRWSGSGTRSGNGNESKSGDGSGSEGKSRNVSKSLDYKNPINFDKKMVKLVKTTIIVIIAVFIANRIISVIEPVMDVLCVDIAKSIATKVSNEQASIVMEKYKYEDISTIVRDEKGNVKMIQMNVSTVNAITSDVALRIQNSLENYKSDEFTIKLGTCTRNQNPIRQRTRYSN